MPLGTDHAEALPPREEFDRLVMLELRVRALLDRPGAVTRAALRSALDPPVEG